MERDMGAAPLEKKTAAIRLMNFKLLKPLGFYQASIQCNKKTVNHELMSHGVLGPPG